MKRRAAILLPMLALLCASARARVALVVGEPFGSFGTMMPVGHAGVLLDDYCADGPLRIRPCRPGQRPGVVIARYHDLRHPSLDWMATPAAVFFYGVEDAAHAPGFVTPALESELRARYRDAQLAAIVPAPAGSRVPKYGDWAESIGAAFDRRLWVYRFDATPEDEAAIAERLNTDSDTRRYTLGRHNCADFAADLLELALPAHTLRRNTLADFDMTTPKQLARALDAFGEAHPERHLAVYEVPQVPGSLRRSRPLRGASDTFLKTKRYLATLLVLQPELVAADWIIYEARGRWTVGQDAVEVTPAWLSQPAPSYSSGSTASTGNGLRAK